MKRVLFSSAIALLSCFIGVADSFDDYVAFCKTEFKFEYCGIDDSIEASRVPMSQKYLEAQFSSPYNMIDLRKTQYNHLVQFESATTNEQRYLLALSNLVADVELAFKRRDTDPGFAFNILYLIKMLEFSIARINASKSEIYVTPQDIDKLLPIKLFKHCDGDVSVIKRYAMMRDLLMIGGYICAYKRTTGQIPLSMADMNISAEHAVQAKYVEYIKQGESWQLIASPTRINSELIEFDKYVPLILGQPERFWRFDSWIILSSNFSKKRKDLYNGMILNEGTPWACRMDGGKVVSCRN